MALSGGLGAAERGEVYQVVVHVDGQALSDPCSEGQCELENGQHIPADTCRRLACDASTLTVTHGPDGGVLNVGRRSRKVTLPLWRGLRRDPNQLRETPGQASWIQAVAVGCKAGRVAVPSTCCGRLTPSPANEKGHTQTKDVARVFPIEPSPE